MLIERLQAEPSVSETRDPTEYSRDRAVDYLTSVVIEHFDLPPYIARAATDISFGLPASAGDYLLHSKPDLKTLEDLTVTMIIGSVVHLKDEYVVRRQPLKPEMLTRIGDNQESTSGAVQAQQSPRDEAGPPRFPA